jgi:hypothetical protein
MTQVAARPRQERHFSPAPERTKSKNLKNSRRVLSSRANLDSKERLWILSSATGVLSGSWPVGWPERPPLSSSFAFFAGVKHLCVDR